jgi:hypothetical protein
MNKPRYGILHAECLELATRLIGDIGEFDPAVAECNPKKTLFRSIAICAFRAKKSPTRHLFPRP